MDPVNTAAPSTPNAAASYDAAVAAPAPPTPPNISPAPAQPDLSNLVQAGSGAQPNRQTAAMGTASEEFQKAQDIAKTPVVDPKMPHARLVQILTSIGEGLSAFGAAASSGGARGGAPMVQEMEGEQQRQKLQAHEARVAEKNSEVQQHITLGDTALRMATSWQNLESMHDEMELRHVQVAGAKQTVAGGALDLQNKAQEMFDTKGQVPAGWSVDPATGQVSQSGQQTPASGAAPSGAPITTAPSGASTKTVGATGAPGVSAVAGAAAGAPSIFNQRQSMILDAADQELKATPTSPSDRLVVGARKILADPSSTPTQKRQAVIAVQNKAGISADVVKTLTAKADLAQKQQAVAAGPEQAQATLAKTRAEAAASIQSASKSAFELGQEKREAASLGTLDAVGFSSPLTVKEYDKRYDSFTKSKDYQTLSTLRGSYQQFQDTMAHITKTGDMTGAESVVGLFNAIGISATPLAGKGFRINSNTIEEHVEARGIDQAAYQKLLKLKSGDVITPKQLQDYSNIAAGVYHNSYVNAADEAHRQGLPVDFLPQGGGRVPDPITARIFMDVVLHTHPELGTNPQAAQAAAMKAAGLNGWKVQ